MNKRALKLSIWASLSRVIGVILGAGAGGILHKAVGDGLGSYSVAFAMAACSFILMLYAEYQQRNM